MKFELFSRPVGLLRRRQFFFRMVAKNGETVAPSEGYKRRADRDSTVRLIKREARDAEIVEVES